jgi:hypothetical protein
VASVKSATKLPGPSAAPSVDVTLHADGVVDFARDRLQVKQRAGFGGVGIAAEMVADPRTVYIKNPIARLRGKTWVSEDLAGAGANPGANARRGAPGERPLTSPDGALSLLTSISDDAKQVGTEELRGTRTTRYLVTVEARTALERQGIGDLDRQQIVQALSGIAADTFLADVWIDDDDRLRKLRYVIEPDDPNADVGRTETTIELFDFGVPPAVELPPAGDVIARSELLGGLGDAVKDRLGDLDDKGLAELEKSFDKLRDQLGDLGEGPDGKGLDDLLKDFGLGSR